jgi:hypothetical protein
MCASFVCVHIGDEKSASFFKKTSTKIDLGVQSVNAWFSFHLDLCCHPNADSMHFRIVRVFSESPRDAKVFDLKVPQEDEFVVTNRERRKKMKIEGRYTRGGHHRHSIILFSRKHGQAEERQEIIIKGNASYLEFEPSEIDFASVVVVPDDDVAPGTDFVCNVPVRRQRISVRNTHTGWLCMHTRVSIKNERRNEQKQKKKNRWL